MGTLITFAELFRDEPVVFLARWQKFDLLFRRKSNDIRLRKKWDASESADFVLSVSKWVFQGNTRWLVEPHAQSLDRCFKCSSVPFLNLDKDGFSSLLAPGQLFSVSTIANADSQDIEIGMRLELNSAGGEVDKVAQTGPLLKPSLENLPSEVHYLLLGRLPLYEVIYVLPYVSHKMFDVVKGGGDWKMVNFTNGVCPSMENLFEFLCTDVAGKCVTLQVKGGAQRRPYDWPEWDLLWCLPPSLRDHSWTKLEEVQLCGFLEYGAVQTMISCLKLGSLPALRTLTLEEPEDLTCCCLRGCNLSSLKHLKIGLRAPGPGQEPDWNHDELWGQFSALETLSVIFMVGASPLEAIRVFPQPTSNSTFLPRLKTLAIRSLPRRAAERIQQELQLFFGLHIERLFIYHLPRVVGEVTEGIPASWLFQTFSHLSDLGIDSSVSINWDRAPEAALRRLVHLRAPLRESGGIPFQRMANLEAAFVQLVSNVPDVPNTAPFSLMDLMKLPKLTSLKISSPTFAYVLIPEDGATCSIRSMDFSNTVDWDMEYGGLPVLRKLVRMVMTNWDFDFDHELTARMFHGVIEKMEGLIQLEVRGPSARAFFESRQYSSNFPSTHWDVRLSGASCVVFRLRTVKECLKKALFVLDDALFCDEL